jgi:hypothetical protein
MSSYHEPNEVLLGAAVWKFVTSWECGERMHHHPRREGGPRYTPAVAGGGGGRA